MRLCLSLLLLASLTAHAGGDLNFEEAAKSRMKLDYDVDQVQGMLAEPAPSAVAVAGAPQARLALAPNSDVDTVTVFLDRALVTRTRTLDLASGEGAVRFEGLPLGIAADSLHAELRSGDATILGVERTSGRGEVADDASTADLRAQARGLAEELGKVRDRIAALLAQREYLRATLMRVGDNQPQPALQQVKGNLDYVGQAEADIAARLRAEEDRAAEIDKKLSPLLVRLQDREATGATVRVDVEATHAGKVTLALSYQVFGAGWTPAYNARLLGDKVELSYYGIVSNLTGETWKDASLFLSTANPSISGELPELTAWTLGEGMDMGGLAAGGGLVSELSNLSGEANQAQQAAGGDSFSTARRAGGAVLFAIPGRRTVAGDGSEQRLPVGTRAFPVVIEYATTPKLVPEVYRRGRVKYTGDAPLLPGAISTFVGADYIGSAPTDSVTPGEELVLSFGTDDRFKVERNLLSREVDHPGAGRRNARYTFHYRINVTNFGDRPEHVLVTDQVPVSESDRVVVKLLDTTPALAPTDDDPPGVMRWALDLAPKQAAVIDLRFSVTGPVDASTAQQFRDLEMMY